MLTGRVSTELVCSREPGVIIGPRASRARDDKGLGDMGTRRRSFAPLEKLLLGEREVSSDDDVLSQKIDFGAGFGVASQSAASCLSLRMSAAIHPFKRLRGLLAFIQVHVIFRKLQSVKVISMVGGQRHGLGREELCGSCSRAR